MAEEYRRRSGERISDGAVKETALRALRKIAIALRADREVCAELGIEWVPLDE